MPLSLLYFAYIPSFSVSFVKTICIPQPPLEYKNYYIYLTQYIPYIYLTFKKLFFYTFYIFIIYFSFLRLRTLWNILFSFHFLLLEFFFPFFFSLENFKVNQKLRSRLSYLRRKKERERGKGLNEYRLKVVPSKGVGLSFWGDALCRIGKATAPVSSVGWFRSGRRRE